MPISLTMAGWQPWGASPMGWNDINFAYGNYNQAFVGFPTGSFDIADFVNQLFVA